MHYWKVVAIFPFKLSVLLERRILITILNKNKLGFNLKLLSTDSISLSQDYSLRRESFCIY